MVERIKKEKSCQVIFKERRYGKVFLKRVHEIREKTEKKRVVGSRIVFSEEFITS